MYQVKSKTRCVALENMGDYDDNGEMRNYATFLLENLKGRDDLEDLVVDGRIILVKWWEGVDWIHLCRDSGLL
jgi:hypothetical protein